MAPPDTGSTEDDFFTLQSRSTNQDQPGRPSGGPNNINGHSISNDEVDGVVPRTKRIACIVCRKRKLKCDGTKPRCGTCARLGHNCAYDEVRKKSGPKRGYVKHLEARLAQVETLLKTQDPSESTEPPNPMPDIPPASFRNVPGIPLSNQPAGSAPPRVSGIGVMGNQLDDVMATPNFPSDGGFSWELISLGLDEALPSQEIIDDLHRIYFEKVHGCMPIIHRPRYLAAMDLAPGMRPPVCLRYAIWTHVCSVTPKYMALAGHFYARARRYAEQDEMKGFGEVMVTIAHSQCWSLIATYEFKMMYFPRAWMSVGRAARLSQMMSLHRQDGAALDVKQTLPPPRDWTEREERRRTFWMAFCHDRYASVGTGWPMTFDERDISTNLPSSEEAYLKSRPERTPSLSGVMTPEGASTLSPFGGVILMACLFGRNLTHLHRPDNEDNDHDINGEFWKRHRALDNILLNTSLSLPHHLRLPEGINDANIVFVNMNIHASTICLHQAAIFKADKNHMSLHISGDSKRRCMIAADQIANIMKLISHIDLSTMNPFIAFCLYVAARVFVQYLKVHNNDAAVISSLQFLLSAMQALKAKNPLTESFLVQLDVDLEGSGIRIPTGRTGQSTVPLRAPTDQSTYVPRNLDRDCSSVFDIRAARESKEDAASINSNGPAVTNMHSQQMPPHPGGFPDRSRSSPLPGGPPDALLNGGASLYTESSGVMDVDLTFESMGGQKYTPLPTSGHPTPSTASNHASSQTSFSPSGYEDNVNQTTSSSMATVPPNTAAPFSNNQAYPMYESDLSGSSKMTGPEGASNPFAMPASWQMTGGGQLLGSRAQEYEATGMTPDGIQHWQPVTVNEGNEWFAATWDGADATA